MNICYLRSKFSSVITNKLAALVHCNQKTRNWCQLILKWFWIIFKANNLCIQLDTSDTMAGFGVWFQKGRAWNYSWTLDIFHPLTVFVLAKIVYCVKMNEHSTWSELQAITNAHISYLFYGCTTPKLSSLHVHSVIIVCTCTCMYHP